jgi:hypothetical protein
VYKKRSRFLQSLRKASRGNVGVWQHPLPPASVVKRKKNRDRINPQISLSDLMLIGLHIQLVCKKCGHRDKLDIGVLAERLGGSTLLREARKNIFCSKCQGKSFEISMK